MDDMFEHNTYKYKRPSSIKSAKGGYVCADTIAKHQYLTLESTMWETIPEHVLSGCKGKYGEGVHTSLKYTLNCENEIQYSRMRALCSNDLYNISVAVETKASTLSRVGYWLAWIALCAVFAVITYEAVDVEVWALCWLPPALLAGIITDNVKDYWERKRKLIEIHDSLELLDDFLYGTMRAISRAYSGVGSCIEQNSGDAGLMPCQEDYNVLTEYQTAYIKNTLEAFNKFAKVYANPIFKRYSNLI